MKKHFAFVAGTAAALLTAAGALRADVVTDWNQTAVQVSQGVAPFNTTAQNTNVATRLQAIEAIAVYNAVNAILREGQFYGGFTYTQPTLTVPLDAARAAAAQAARDVLYNYYTSTANRTELDARLATSLAAIPDGADKTAGIAAGQAAATHIIALRANDGAGASVSFPGNTGVGQWRPTPSATPPFTFAAASTPQWGDVTPFVLPSVNTIPVLAPPAVGSAEYNKARAEVQTIGRNTSGRRTLDQTRIGNYWRSNPEIQASEAARTLVTFNNLPLWDSAYTFLVFNLALADARIVTYKAKYVYSYWRPVTALNADETGAVTNDYAAWLPLNATPSHPAYPAGTPTAASAAVAVLRHFFGDLNALTLTSPTGNPPQRSYTRLSQIDAEAGLARVYAGFHWKFDVTEGQRVARAVAAYVIQNGPQPNP